MRAVEVVTARGHENILATNKNTFEITKDTCLTKRGTCIIAVAADKSGKDFDYNFRRMLRKTSGKLTIVVQVGEEKEVVEAWGDSKLTFNHPTDLVVRKSSFVCDRTMAINANKAAKDLQRSLVTRLKDFRQKVYIKLIVEDNTRNTRIQQPL